MKVFIVIDCIANENEFVFKTKEAAIKYINETIGKYGTGVYDENDFKIEIHDVKE